MNFITDLNINHEKCILHSNAQAWQTYSRGGTWIGHKKSCIISYLRLWKIWMWSWLKNEALLVIHWYTCNILFRWVMFVEKSVCDVDSKLMIHHETLKKLKRKLEIIHQMAEAPYVYASAIVEVVRRKIFTTRFLDVSWNLFVLFCCICHVYFYLMCCQVSFCTPICKWPTLYSMLMVKFYLHFEKYSVTHLYHHRVVCSVENEGWIIGPGVIWLLMTWIPILSLKQTVITFICYHSLFANGPRCCWVMLSLFLAIMTKTIYK